MKKKKENRKKKKKRVLYMYSDHPTRHTKAVIPTAFSPLSRSLHEYKSCFPPTFPLIIAHEMSIGPFNQEGFHFTCTCFSTLIPRILSKEMDNRRASLAGRLFGSSVGYMRSFIFRVLSIGPIPNHVAFILDGNRRYAKKWNLGEGMGHRAGFLSLMSLLKYCWELGVKYVTIYAFSIDNFKRRADEVQSVMDLMLEKIEGFLKEESVVNQYGVRIYFVGDLSLLSEPVRIAANKAMESTSNNNKSILLVCVAYTSTDEILHAAVESCEDKLCEIQSLKKPSERNNNNEEQEAIKLVDIERHMYMGVAPDPDILVRTSGETRLSNFLLWQTSNCLLYSPNALWPEIGLWELVWAVITFQRALPQLEKTKKQL